jgi:hypothetical protein
MNKVNPSLFEKPVPVEEKPPIIVSAPVYSNGRRDDWCWRDNPDVVIHEQPRTAVYSNPYGSVVIRQEAAWDAEDDAYVYFTPSNIPTLIKSLHELLQALQAE